MTMTIVLAMAVGALSFLSQAAQWRTAAALQNRLRQLSRRRARG